MILKIKLGNFQVRFLAGDLLAIANLVEYLRITQKDPNLQFNIDRRAIYNIKHCHEMYDFIIENSDYFTEEKASDILRWRGVNPWEFRGVCGDRIKIPNNKQNKKKLVVFPLLDAAYDTWRNWPIDIFKHILDSHRNFDGEKIICIKTKDLIDSTVNLEGYEISTDYVKNLYHILDCGTFIGGETGTTHLAWSLDDKSKNLIFYGSGIMSVHTLPFHLLQGKGEMRQYFVNTRNCKF